MQPGWILKEGTVLASAERADGLGDRVRGLLGTRGYEGAMLFPHTRSVHTLFMRYPLDVAFLDAELTVRDIRRLAPWRMRLPRPAVRSVLEAEAGSFERWGLAEGDRLEFREAG